MLEFEVFYHKHGEIFMDEILHNWERDNRVCHVRPLTLEERWDYFLVSTECANGTAA